MNTKVKTWLVRALLAGVLVAVAAFAWLKYRGNGEDAGLASGNGRIEAMLYSSSPV